MQPTRVAAVSMNSEFAKQREVLDRVREWCEKAAGEKADLVLFPELIVHGHNHPDTWKIAERIPEGSSTQKLVEFAQHYKLHLAVAWPRRKTASSTTPRWSSAPKATSGSSGRFTCRATSPLFYKGGREISVFDLGKCKVGIVICYDNQIPEVGRIVALKGADIILMPHAAREGRWTDTPESEAAARRKVFEFFKMCYPMRGARERLLRGVRGPGGPRRDGRLSAPGPHEPAASSRRRDRFQPGRTDPQTHADRTDPRRDDRVRPRSRAARKGAEPPELHAPHAASGGVRGAGAGSAYVLNAKTRIRAATPAAMMTKMARRRLRATGDAGFTVTTPPS